MAKKKRSTPHGYNDIFDIITNDSTLRNAAPSFASKLGFNNSNKIEDFGEANLPKRKITGGTKTNIHKARRAFSRRRYSALKSGGAPIDAMEESNYSQQRGIRGESVYDIY